MDDSESYEGRNGGFHEPRNTNSCPTSSQPAATAIGRQVNKLVKGMHDGPASDLKNNTLPRGFNGGIKKYGQNTVITTDGETSITGAGDATDLENNKTKAFCIML